MIRYYKIGERVYFGYGRKNRPYDILCGMISGVIHDFYKYKVCSNGRTYHVHVSEMKTAKEAKEWYEKKA